MGFEIKREKFHQDVDVWVNVFEDFSGGVTIVASSVRGNLIPAGTLAFVDEAKRLVTPIYVVTVKEQAMLNATTFKVRAGVVKKGDILGHDSGHACTVSKVEKGNGFDTVTIDLNGSTGFPALNIGDALFIAKEAGASGAEMAILPNGLFRKTYKVEGSNNFASVVRRGTVYSNRLEYGVPDAVKTALQGLIVFSKQS